MVRLKVGADFSPAEQEINEFQTVLGAAAKKAGDALENEIEAGAKGAAQALGTVEDAAERTARASEAMAAKMSLDDKIAGISAFKDTVEKGIAPLLGFSEATTAAVTRASDLANVGASFGKIFGPQWALALGVVGGALGLAAEAALRFTGKSKELAAAKDKLKEATDRTAQAERDYRVEVEKNGVATIEVIRKQIDALKNEAKARLEVQKAGGSPENWASYEIRAEEIESKFGDLADTAGAAVKSTESLKKELGLLPKDTVEQLEAASTKATKSFKEADEQVAKLQKELKGIDSRNLTLLDEKTAELEEALTDQAKAAQKAGEAHNSYKSALSGVVKAEVDLTPPIAANNEELKKREAFLTSLTEKIKKGELTFDYFSGQLVPTQKIGDALLYVREGYQEILDKRKELDELTGGEVDAEKLKRQTDAELAAIDEAQRAYIEANPIELPIVVTEGMKKAQEEFNAFAASARAQMQGVGDDINEAFSAFLSDTLSAGIEKISSNVAKGANAFEGLAEVVAASAEAQLKALAKNWAFQAGAEGAAALVSLATGNLPGAALHGQAAAIYGALALAAGVGGGLVGRALPEGGGAASPSSSPASSPASSSGGGGGASFGGALETQELAPAIINLAPGGTLVFPNDPRGKAAFGRFTEGAIAAGNKALPIKR